jgi:hypothetical protein
MRERIAFQKRGDSVDPYDGTVVVGTGPWETVFEEPAKMIPGTGSETFAASRLQGVQPYTMVIRSSERTREITPAWQAVDVRGGSREDGSPKRVFDIKAVANPDRWNGLLNLIVIQQ